MDRDSDRARCVADQLRNQLCPGPLGLRHPSEDGALRGLADRVSSISAVGGLLAWREWKQLGSELPGEGGGAIPRSRIMALAGMLLSAMFCLVIIAQAIPELMLGACE